jgi:hypothetical protein
MAGVKVTDLTPLATADPTDIMYIVDTTANQSKQIEVQDIYSGMPQFASGGWNPTPTNTGGTNASVVIQGGNYSRVDSVVTCSLFLDVQMDAAETGAEFELNLPVASDFTNAKNAFGIVAYSNVSDGELVNWVISANTTSDKIVIIVTSVTNGHNFQSLYVVLQYVIL